MYQNNPIFNGVCLKVKAGFRTKVVEQISIASDDIIEGEGTGDIIVDLVYAFKLNEIQ